MKKILILGAASAALMAAACTTTDPYTGQTVRNNTGTGALAGAILGAGAGTLAGGNDTRNAAIGAGIGALAGAAAGNYMDRQQAQLRQELAGTGIEVDRRGDDIVLNMPGDITFAVDSANIQPQFDSVLTNLANTLREYNQTTIDVIGHADSTGSDSYNQQLSERRASSVAQALTSRGVIPERIFVAGRGEAQPIASNDTPEGRSRNRRVEITLRPITQS